MSLSSLTVLIGDRQSWWQQAWGLRFFNMELWIWYGFGGLVFRVLSKIFAMSFLRLAIRYAGLVGLLVTDLTGPGHWSLGTPLGYGLCPYILTIRMFSCQ